LWRAFTQRELFKKAKEKLQEEARMKKRLEFLEHQSSSAFVRTFLKAKNLFGNTPKNAHGNNKSKLMQAFPYQKKLSKSYQNIDILDERSLSPKMTNTLDQKKSLSQVLDDQPSLISYKPLQTMSPKSPSILKDKLKAIE